MKRLHAVLAAGAALALCGSAQATDLVLRVGVHDVVPTSNNNPTVHVGSNATLSVDGALFVTDTLAIDLLGAMPFKHDITLNANGAKVGSVRQLPPTLGVQYHFNRGGFFDTHIGAGINYTLFFDKQTTGALAGTRLALDNSFGGALQAGADIALGDDWLLGIDIRWIAIKAEARVNGNSIGDVKVDPMVYGLTIGRRFSL